MRSVAAAGVCAVLLAACGQMPVGADADAAITDGSAIDVGDVTLDDAARDVVSEDAPWRCERMRAMPSDAALPCNGAPELCARRFDQVAYPTAHNAMSNADERWTIPNQNHGLTRQLADGVRGLMLDTHYYLGRAFLCHGPCELGRKRLAEGLCEITQFLDRNPGEVVSIIFESYVSAVDTAAAFTETGLDEYVHTQLPTTPWPTLQQMIAAGHRLVVFTDTGGGMPAWYHPVWDHAWETNYAFRTAADFTCTINRGRMSNPLFILNHFLTNPIAMPSFGDMVNRNPLFIDRARACMASSGRLPNFVTVDYYDVGDLFAVTRAMNGI